MKEKDFLLLIQTAVLYQSMKLSVPSCHFVVKALSEGSSWEVSPELPPHPWVKPCSILTVIIWEGFVTKEEELLLQILTRHNELLITQLLCNQFVITKISMPGTLSLLSRAKLNSVSRTAFQNGCKEQGNLNVPGKFSVHKEYTWFIGKQFRESKASFRK